MRPERRWSLVRIDVALGVFVVLVHAAVAVGSDGEHGPVWLNAAAGVLPGVTLALRRRYPIGAFAVFFAVVGVQSLFLLGPDDSPAIFLPLVLMPYAPGAWTDRGVWVMAFPLWTLVAVNVSAPDAVFGDYVFPGAMLMGSWLAGRAVRTRTALTAELHEAAIRAEEEHDRTAAAAIADERRRIAREMHDVVAHSISVMVIQAGGARRILDRDPDRAVAAAEQIERTGREALGEMRRLLGVLRTEEARSGLAPQPGLDGLEALLERTREAGLEAELHVTGDARPLPPGLDLTAYRIVQEALTNALKHAHGSRAEVGVAYGARELRLRVSDDGEPGGAEPAVPGGGHGLVGMRERVRVYGGEVEAGPLPGGGFEVRARLPLVGEDEQAGHAVAGALA